MVIGAGKVGSKIVSDLLDYYEDIELIVCDIDRSKLNSIKMLGGDRVYTKKLDVRDVDSVVSVLKGVDAVVNATYYGYAINIIEASIKTRTPYTDLGSSLYKTDRMFREAGVPAVMDTGGAPGLINMLTKFAVERLDMVEYIHLYDVSTEVLSDVDVPLRYKYNVETILDEAIMDSVIYRDGEFIKVPPFSGLEERLFPPPIGRVKVFHIYHPEVETLANNFRDRGLREVWYKIDAFSLPWEEGMKWRLLAELGFASVNEVDVGGVKVIPRELLLRMLRKLGGGDGYWRGYEMLLSEVSGTVYGRCVRFDVYAYAEIDSITGSVLTASPAAITGYMLAKGMIDEPGAYPVESVIDTKFFFKELSRRPIALKYECCETVSF